MARKSMKAPTRKPTKQQAETKQKQAEESATMAMSGNATAMKTTIRGVHNELLKLEAKKAEIGEAITSQRGRIKGLGMKMADFYAARRIIMLEGDDQGIALDGFRLTFEALSLGENLDWLKTTGQDVKQPKPPKATRVDASGNGAAKDEKPTLATGGGPKSTSRPPAPIKGTPLDQEDF